MVRENSAVAVTAVSLPVVKLVRLVAENCTTRQNVKVVFFENDWCITVAELSE